MQDGVALTRKLKPVPNRFIQETLKTVPDGFDGELIVGRATNDARDEGTSVMKRTSSGVMSRDGEPDFTYVVFDRFNEDWPTEAFHQRWSTVGAMLLRKPWGKYVQHCPHRPVNDLAELMAAEDAVVKQGYEGLMLRDPNGHYKQGRSTAIEGGLNKMKRFFDAEGVVVDYIEQMTNTNEKERDALGHAKRSKKKAGLVGADTLGTLVCSTRLRGDGTLGIEGCETDRTIRFELGGGFTAADRAALWARRHKDLIGSTHKFKFQELTPDGIPRFQVWLGERNRIDL